MLKKRLGFVVLGCASASAVLFACVGEIYDSVHYNGAQPDFGLPPSRTVINSWGEEFSRPVPGAGADWRYEEYDENKEKEREERITRLRGQAERALGSEQYGTAKSALEALLREDIEDKEIMRDRLEVLAENEKSRLPANLLNSYFRARAAENGVSGLTAIANDPQAGFLQAFAEYGLAATSYDAGNFKEAAKKYELVVEKYPSSPKREAALMMAIRMRLRGEETESGAVRIDPADRAAGQKAIAQLRQQYPSSRFLTSAEGWETRAIFLEGKTGQAFLRYLGELKKARTYDERVSVLSSLRTVKNAMREPEADKVRGGLFEKPDLLQPYLELRLYHSGEDLKKDLAGLSKLTKEVLDQHPNTPVSAGIRARLAEIAYLQGDYKTAEDWSNQALKATAGADARRDLATYVLASAQMKGKRYPEAEANYKKVVDDFSDSYLVDAARENLALVYESAGRWDAALDQYRALKYSYDIATLLDVRMTTEEIKSYIGARSNDPELSWLQYALGMRYLRKENLDEAEKWFKLIPEAKRKDLAQAGSKGYSWYGDEEGSGPIDRMVDPLETIASLRTFNKKIAEASGSDAKAEAQYALASFWYENRNLLLYNSSLWHGGRSVLAGFWDAGVDKVGYEKAILEHHYEHECLWKARKICVTLAKEAPKAKVSAKALYRAACAARRLADFNSYWRDPKLSNPLWKECVALMKRVAAEYPTDPLAKDAAKYAKAFAEEGEADAKQTMFKN